MMALFLLQVKWQWVSCVCAGWEVPVASAVDRTFACSLCQRFSSEVDLSLSLSISNLLEVDSKAKARHWMVQNCILTRTLTLLIKR